MFSTRQFYIYSIILLKAIVDGSNALRVQSSDNNLLPERLYSKKYDKQNDIQTVDNDYGSVFEVIHAPRNAEPKEKLNRVLVKRIIPHGHRTAKYVFDDKFETFYKPLFRIHNKKPKKGNDIQYDGYNVNKPYPVFIINKQGGVNNRNSIDKQMTNDYTKKALLQPFDIKTYSNKKDRNREYKKILLNNSPKNYKTIDGTLENQNLLEMLKRSRILKNKKLKKLASKNSLQHETKVPNNDKIIKHLRWILKSVDNESKKNIYNKIWKIINKRNLRLGYVRDKSGESDYQTPKVIFHIPTTKAPRINRLPEYSFWHYWTYDKTLHQDDCKGDLIKFNNVCVVSNYNRKK